MPGLLDGRIALITGAGSGIGEAIALAMAGAGARIVSVDIDGPYNMVTAFLDQLRETRGAIINIGSIQSFVALPNSAAYTTSKGGVRLLTKALAIELSPLGIRVNAIGPGFTATPLNADARQNAEYMANFTGRIPLGRIGTPADIAKPAGCLACDMGS